MLLLCGLLLGGCGAAGLGAGSGLRPAPALGLRQQAQQLPGAQLATGEPLRIGYPQLFAPEAALPLAGGVEQLRPLGDFLQQAGTTRWQLRVRGEGELGLALAKARAELLRGFFARRGLAAERFEWLVEAGAGAALELQLDSIP
jgi:hypothetical protein